MEDQVKRRGDEDDRYAGVNTVVSMGDCTGLIPANPASKDECESYEEMYDVPVPKPGRKGFEGKG